MCLDMQQLTTNRLFPPGPRNLAECDDKFAGTKECVCSGAKASISLKDWKSRLWTTHRAARLAALASLSLVAAIFLVLTTSTQHAPVRIEQVKTPTKI